MRIMSKQTWTRPGAILVATATAAAFLLVGSAAGGAPGKWSSIATGQGLHGPAQEVGLARTPDGVLHVAWREDTGPSSAVIRTRSISATGGLGPVVTAVSNSPLPADPDLAVDPGGLRLFFGSGSPVEGLRTSTSPASGSTWSAPETVVNGRAGTPAVATTADGTSFQTWPASSIAVHRGLTPGPVHLLASPAGAVSARPNIAADSSGRIWVVWCRYGGPRPMGTIAQQVDPSTGAPLGPQVQLPGSSTDYQGNPNANCVLDATVARREPLAARAGGGAYAAGTSGYPRLARVLVWRLDATGVTRTLVAARAGSAAQLGYSDPALAAGPDGRIWAARLDKKPQATRIVARRSNRAGTALGAPVTVTPPGGILTAALNLSAQADRLDVIALLQTRGGALRIDHTQLWPGLTLVRSGITLRGKNAALVTLRALDAGEAVSGVRVRIGGRASVTKANGTAKILVRRTARERRLTAKAARAGYVGSAVKVAIPASKQ
jgi:hypothetical protein